MATNCMKVIYNLIVNLVVVELACLGPACLTFTKIKLDKECKKLSNSSQNGSAFLTTRFRHQLDQHY